MAAGKLNYSGINHLRRSFRILVAAGLFGIAGIMVVSLLWPVPPLVIAAHIWSGYEPLFLADREGWLDKRQVNLLEVQSATESLQALAEGRVEGATLTLDEALRARAEGVPLSIVLVFDISAGADALLVKPSIKTLADLKHKRVGLEETALGALMLSQVLRQAGLSRKDITAVSATIDHHAEVWRKQAVDALITFEPVASQLQAEGGIKLFDSRQLPNMIVDVLVIREDVLAQKPDAVRHLIATQLRGLEHLRRNPQDAAFRMAQHLKLPPLQLWSAFKGLLLPDLEGNYRLLAGERPKLVAGSEQLISVMMNEGLLTQKPSLEHLIRADFLPPLREEE